MYMYGYYLSMENIICVSGEVTLEASHLYFR